MPRLPTTVAGGTYVTGLQQSAEQNLARFAAAYQVATGARGAGRLFQLGGGVLSPALSRRRCK